MIRACLSLLLFMTCSFIQEQTNPQLIDERATPETKALFYNLHRLSKTNILFGHQHATEYGHGWYGDTDRSDVKSVTGSHPAVIGVDFMGLSGRSEEEIEKNRLQLKRNIED